MTDCGEVTFQEDGGGGGGAGVTEQYLEGQSPASFAIINEASLETGSCPTTVQQFTYAYSVGAG